MIEADRKRFKQLMMQVAAEKRYQDQLDDPLLRIMWNAMEGEVTIDDLERVAPSIVKNHRFFPRVDEWLDAVHGLPPPTVLGLLPPSGETGQTGKPIYCLKCRDEGWMFVNDTNPARVVECECRQTNPALGAGQRKKRRSDP